MKVTQANPQAGQFGTSTIAGAFTNPTAAAVMGVSVEIYCFDGTGMTLAGETSTSASQETVPAHGTGSFDANLPSGQLCPTHLVGASGFPAS